MKTIETWFLWLMIYSIIGWVYESTICSIGHRKLINRGFLNGPYCPIYGTGAVLVLLSPHVLRQRNGAFPLIATGLALLPGAIIGVWQGSAATLLFGIGTILLGTLSAPVMRRAIESIRGGRSFETLESRLSVGYLLLMLLCAALMQTAGTVVGPGQPEAWGVFGSMLLRQDAGGYVLVAVVSFAAAAAITALCFRLKNRENQKKGGADKPAPQEQEEKSQ